MPQWSLPGQHKIIRRRCQPKHSFLPPQEATNSSKPQPSYERRWEFVLLVFFWVFRTVLPVWSSVVWVNIYNSWRRPLWLMRTARTSKWILLGQLSVTPEDANRGFQWSLVIFSVQSSYIQEYSLSPFPLLAWKRQVFQNLVIIQYDQNSV